MGITSNWQTTRNIGSLTKNVLSSNYVERIGRERFLVKLYIVESDFNNDKVTLMIKVTNLQNSYKNLHSHELIQVYDYDTQTR